MWIQDDKNPTLDKWLVPFFLIGAKVKLQYCGDKLYIEEELTFTIEDSGIIQSKLQSLA